MAVYDSDEAYLDHLEHPVELGQLSVPAGGAMSLDAQWVAYLDEAHLPTHVAGVDERLHHEDRRHGIPEGGTAYA